MAHTNVHTFDELYAIAKAAALLRTSKLSDRSFSPGYMMDVVAGLSSALGEEAERYALELHLKTFYRTASGADLDRLAEDHFSLTRQGGVAAIGVVRFSRPTAGFGSITIPVGTLVETADGTQFQTTEAPLLTGLQIDADVQAVETGDGGNVAAGTVTVLTASLADTSITVTNPEEMAGGIAKETDSAFRQRIIDFFRTIRRGTVLALEVGAKSVGGVVTASVDESAYPPTVYVADTTGSANATLAQAVKDELVNWRSAGVAVNVVGATVVQQTVDVTLTFTAGSDTSAVRDQVREAIVLAVNTLDIGDTLYRSLIVAAARSIRGVLDVVVNDPAGDVAPLANELIRTDATQVTI